MKAQELRIGNWIEQNENVCKVYQVEHRYKDIYRVNDLNSNEQELNPIEITEEWLERFGFLKPEINQFESYILSAYKTVNDLSFGITIIEGSFFIQLIREDGSLGLGQVNRIHQLQNLYYLLTGEELTMGEETEAVTSDVTDKEFNVEV